MDGRLKRIRSTSAAQLAADRRASDSGSKGDRIRTSVLHGGTEDSSKLGNCTACLKDGTALTVWTSPTKGFGPSQSLWLRRDRELRWKPRPSGDARLSMNHVVTSWQANAAIALHQLTGDQNLWSLLGSYPDPRRRATLIARMADYGVGAVQLLEQLDRSTEPMQRQALMLGLAEFDSDSLAVDAREQLFARNVELFTTDPDPGVHAAAEFVLRRGGRQSSIDDANDRLAGSIESGRSWHVDHHGHTLAIVQGPLEFRMGSQRHTRGRDDFLEVLHSRRIDRSIAAALHEVTVEQFRKFKADFGYSIAESPQPDCPINSTTWYDAARYCRWLSEAEHVPEDQMCYPPVDQIVPGMRLPSNHLDRTGYRLPTEAEWEYLCQSGTRTERSFGQTETLLDRYAWTIANSVENGIYRTWPVGSKLPNDFDMLGNMLEWCDDPFVPAADFEHGRPIGDLPHRTSVENSDRRNI